MINHAAIREAVANRLAEIPGLNQVLPYEVRAEALRDMPSASLWRSEDTAPLGDESYAELQRYDYRVFFAVRVFIRDDDGSSAAQEMADDATAWLLELFKDVGETTTSDASNRVDWMRVTSARVLDRDESPAQVLVVEADLSVSVTTD